MKRTLKNTMVLFFCLIFTLTLAACSGSKKDDTKGEEFVTEVLESLTAPELRGRLVGTEGNKTATQYLAELYEEIGLIPLERNGYEWSYEDIIYDPDISNPTVKFICENGEEITPVFGEDFSFNMAYGDIDIKFNVTRYINEITPDKAANTILVTDEPLENLMKSENYKNILYRITPNSPELRTYP